MVGKTLTLLEMHLLKKSQGEKIKNNKLLFQTWHIYIYIYMTYMFKSINQVYLQKLEKKFYSLSSKFIVCSLKTSIEVHSNRIEIFLLYFWKAFDVNPWKNIWTKNYDLIMQNKCLYKILILSEKKNSYRWKLD